MIRVNVREAKQNLSHLLDQVENGEEVTILRRHQIIAHIVPHIQGKKLKIIAEFKDFSQGHKSSW